MKIKNWLPHLRNDGEIVAYFGQARLVRRLDCAFELRGGSAEDHTAAKEWISLFMHEAVLLPLAASQSKRDNNRRTVSKASTQTVVPLS